MAAVALYADLVNGQVDEAIWATASPRAATSPWLIPNSQPTASVTALAVEYLRVTFLGLVAVFVYPPLITELAAGLEQTAAELETILRTFEALIAIAHPDFRASLSEASA